MSGWFADRFIGNARAEMRDRTEQVLKAVQKLDGSLKRNTRALRGLAKVVTPGLKQELTGSLDEIVKTEKELDVSLHAHIQALEAIVRQLG